MIRAEKSLVEILLLQFREFVLEFVLQVIEIPVSRRDKAAPPPLPSAYPCVRTSSIWMPALSGLDMASEISFARSRCSLMAVIVASTLSMLLETPAKTKTKRKKKGRNERTK